MTSKDYESNSNNKLIEAIAMLWESYLILECLILIMSLMTSMIIFWMSRDYWTSREVHYWERLRWKYWQTDIKGSRFMVEHILSNLTRLIFDVMCQQIFYFFFGGNQTNLSENKSKSQWKKISSKCFELENVISSSWPQCLRSFFFDLDDDTVQ